MKRPTLSQIIQRTALLGSLVLASVAASAQIAAWDFTGPGNTTTQAATTFNANLFSSNLVTRGATAAASAGANSFRTVGFKNDGIATSNTDYFQVTLGAAAGYKVSLSTIDAKFTGTASFAAGTGVTHQFAYSLDGTTFTLIGSAQLISGTTQTLGQINVSGVGALQNVAAGTTIYLRYYASGQTATGGWGFFSTSLGTNGLAIGGTVNAVAVNTSVQFSSTSGTVAENGGTTTLPLAITNFSTTAATSVTMGYTDPNGRITSVTSPVTFPANNGSSQNATVTITDDALCNGDEAIPFTITGISGGQGTPVIGTNSTYTLTVTDDDVCYNTSVQFNGTTGTAAENAGSINIPLSITDPDAISATSVTITATGATGRISTFTSPVTFAGGSGDDENMTVALADNSICDGDQDVTFTIDGISGGAGTAYIGANNTFTLTVINDDMLLPPVATTPTVINSNDFTATWNAAASATGYEIDVSTSPTFSISSPVTTTEGFNTYPATPPAGWTFTSIATYTGAGFYGVSSPGLKFDATNDQVVTPLLSAPVTDLSFFYYLNGTSVLSSFLVEGFDGTTWSTLENIVPIPQTAGTKHYTGIGGSGYVQFRFTYTKDAGNLVFDDVSITCGCGSTPSFLPGYQDSVVTGTSLSIPGLTPLTDYYYRVRSTGGGCPTTGNSNTMHVQTAAGPEPVLNVGTLADFGDVCLGQEGGPSSFTVDGYNLDATDVTVTALDGFSYSTSEFGTYMPSLSISQPGGTFSQIIWVKFDPTAVQSYDGNIVVGGGSAPDAPVPATANGINTLASVTTGAASAVGLDAATVAGSIGDAGCSAVTAYGVEYSTVMNFSEGSGTQVPSTNLSAGDFSSDLTGLDACSTYWFRAYATTGAGTAYGAQGSFSTDGIDTVVATTPVVVNSTDFTATWDPVTGASGYRLDVSTLPDFGVTVNSDSETAGRASLPSGWSNVGLGTDYASDGNPPPSIKFDTSGDTLFTKTYPVGASSISFWYKGQGTLGSASTLLVEAFNGSTWTALGSVGSLASSAIGNRSYTLNPGDGYVKFRLSYTKVSGNFAIDNVTVTYLTGTPSYVSGYDNLAVAGTSQSVMGLAASTDYYYRVRAESANCPLVNSNTMAVTTTSGICGGNQVVVAINTDSNPDQITWSISDESDAVIATGGPTAGQANMLVSQTVCLGTTAGPACYSFRLMDSYGDGLSGVGNWQLKTTSGKVLLGDDFADGFNSPSLTPASPAYTGHFFCLPEGPANIAANECGIFNNALGNKVYATPVAGASQYQFEFSDPDAGFRRWITVPTVYVHFSQMVTYPLVPGRKYFARVRTNVAGPVADAHFGSGCEMGLGIPQTVPCSSLIQAPSYGHSCNETRPFGSYGFIYAYPVNGANYYQFHIYNTNEGYDTTITRNTYILQLKWTGNRPLVNGSVYNVQVNTSVNGVQSGFCASSCQITIQNAMHMRPEQRVASVAGADLNLWPNPVREGQVNLLLNGLGTKDQQIAVDIYDIYGRKVLSNSYANSTDRFSTVLDLPGDIASGVYMVNITVNGNTTVQRLSVIK